MALCARFQTGKHGTACGYNASTPTEEGQAEGTQQLPLSVTTYKHNPGYALYTFLSYGTIWKQPNCKFPMYLVLQYRRAPPVDKSTLVAFLPFFPVPFAFCISELSAAATALLEDMMLANDNAGVANGPAYNRNILLLPGLIGSNCNTLTSVQKT